ncbi:MAG: ABC transporter ATP-binding protein [Gemmatimonadota bacterium]
MMNERRGASTAVDAVTAHDVHYRYGRTDSLRGVTLSIPDGAVYALLGPNGAGKTTLLHLLAGLRRASRGSCTVLGRDSARLTVQDRQQIGYVAEGQRLPGWMRLEQLEAYLAPLYPRWDATLATGLRERFALDRRRKIGSLSRGEYMKAALLCALAPRPKVLLMDEPFTGMDVSVRDELVRGLLDSANDEGWTVVISSHDIAELEMLADWVGFLQHGEMRLSESMESLQARFRHVDVIADSVRDNHAARDVRWLAVEQAGRRLSFVVDDGAGALEQGGLQARFPDAVHVEVREASLREVFIAMARGSRELNAMEVMS